MVVAVLGIASATLSSPALSQGAGDPKRGEEAYARLCVGCHSIEQNRIGPMHRGVVGRRVGSVAGFKYSDALAQSKLTWDAALLERWLADPEATIKGQRMGFRVNSSETRADLIAYLAAQVSRK